MWLSSCRKIFKSACVSSKLVASKSASTFSGDVIDLSYKSYDDYTSGSQTPVLVQHGLLASRNNWSNISEAINKNTGRKVINVDVRNHGTSQHSSQHTYIHMAHDTKRLINRLEIPKVSFLGHSMGGRTGMVLSLLNPELVSNLIVVDISPVSMSESLTTTFPQLLDYATTLDLRHYTRVDEAKAFVKEKLLAFGTKQMDALHIILNNIGIKPDGTVGWTCNIDILNRNFETLVRFPYIPGRAYTGPVLFIAGGDSDFIPLEDMDGIKSYFPRAQLEYVPGVGHNIHDEDAPTLIKLATEFLLKTNRL